jgi:hypothetical protein
MKIISAIILTCFCITAVKADEERIWMDAKINGKPVRLVLDTGTTGDIAIYSTTAKKLGIKYRPPDSHSESGLTSVGWTEPCHINFGTNNANFSFHTDDISFGTGIRLAVVEMPAYLKPSEDGIIGWAAIKDKVISIDAIADKISFDVYGLLGGDKWKTFQLETRLGLLALDIPLENGANGVVLLDTGSPRGVELNPQKWSEWKSSHTNQPSTFESYYTPSIGPVIKEESWADKISLGSLMLTDVPVMEADANDVTLASLPQTQYEATLGLAAIKRLDIIVDGQNGFASIRPKTTAPLPYQHNRLGAGFIPRDSQSDDLIAHIASGSPAYKAGIRDGDILLKVGKLDFTKWRTDTNPPADYVGQPGTKLKLTLKRGDKIFKTTATLQNILPPDAQKNSN